MVFHATSSSNVYYAGTKIDASVIATPIYCSKANEACEFTKGFPFIWPLALIDLPLSVLADTIYFPFQYDPPSLTNRSRRDPVSGEPATGRPELQR